VCFGQDVPAYRLRHTMAAGVEWSAKTYADNVGFVSELGEGVLSWLAPSKGLKVQWTRGSLIERLLFAQNPTKFSTSSHHCVLMHAHLQAHIFEGRPIGSW
jgi:hypothetical protein